MTGRMHAQDREGWKSCTSGNRGTSVLPRKKGVKPVMIKMTMFKRNYKLQSKSKYRNLFSAQAAKSRIKYRNEDN